MCLSPPAPPFSVTDWVFDGETQPIAERREKAWRLQLVGDGAAKPLWTATPKCR